MEKRSDLTTAQRIDQALTRMPEIGWLEVACLLAANGVPLEVAARVLALPAARRDHPASNETLIAP